MIGNVTAIVVLWKLYPHFGYKNREITGVQGVAVYTSGPRSLVRVTVPKKAGSPVAESFGKERDPFHFSLRILRCKLRKNFSGYKAKTKNTLYPDLFTRGKWFLWPKDIGDPG
jgi:hypothetical protein